MLPVVGTSLSVHEGYVDTSEQMTVEAASQVKKRQKRSVEEKRRIVEETLAAGASVARVARRHAVNANQVSKPPRRHERGRWATGVPTATEFKGRINSDKARKRHRTRHLEFYTPRLLTDRLQVRVLPGEPTSIRATRCI